MSSQFSNIRGTSEVHFRISLGGPTIYFGTAAPSGTPPTSLDGGALNPGDLYIRTDPTNPGIYTLGNGGDSDWSEVLVAGGPIVVGGDLSVGGSIDQNGELLLINADLSAIPSPGSGIEIGRAGDNVFWVWDDANSWWKPWSTTPTNSLHNVTIGNDLRVDGELRVATGTQGIPSIYFGAATTTGIFLPSAGEIGFTSAGTERWRIATSGDFIPGTTDSWNIGSTSLLPSVVFGTRHIAGAGFTIAASPSFSFNTETNTGIFHPSAGNVAISGNGVELAHFDATTQKIAFSGISGPDALTASGINDVFLKLVTATAGFDAGIELVGPGGAADNWEINLNSSTSSQLDFTYGGTDVIDISTSGKIHGIDGSAVAPTYSFKTDDGAGMYLNGSGGLSFSVGGSELFKVNNTGVLEATTIAYETLLSADNEIPNKKYVDDLLVNSSWREPVIVKDDNLYGNLSAAEAQVNTGTVDGVAVSTDDGILFTNITGENPNVFYVTGTIPTATLTEDTNLNTPGDAVYVVDGTDAGKVFAYDVGGTWTEISGAGGGAPLISYETQTGLSGTPVINFSTVTYVVGSDSLLVYLNGQKMISGVHYTETSSTSITWVTPALVGADTLEFYSAYPFVAGSNLGDIADVSAAAPNDGDVLTWNNGTSMWEPSTGVFVDELVDGVGGNGPLIFNTVNVTTIAKTATKAFIQVFVNGILQKEGSNFTVTGVNQITFIVGPPAAADVTIYQLK